MKKVFLILALAALAPAWSGDLPIRIGIRGGGNMANIVLPVSNGDVQWGFKAGLFAEIALDDNLTFQPEAQYTVKGVQFFYSKIGYAAGPSGPFYTYTNASYSDSYDYLEVPLLIKVHQALSPGWVGSLSLGPSFGFFLSGNQHYSIASPSMSGDTPLSGVSALDLGVMVGAGLELDPVLIDLRYDRGLTNAFQNNPGGANSVLSLDLGFRLL